MKCVIEGCKRAAKHLGMCGRHYTRNKKHGDPHHYGRYGVKDPDEWFWDQFAVTDDDECWVWKGLLDRRGYGRIYWNGSMCAAHRVAFNLAYHAIPEGVVIRHTCDNPPCCNPKHLAMGTQADNMRDMVHKNRSCRGESASWSKLTEDAVRSIRKRYKEGVMQKDLAEEYGVTVSCVGSVVTRKNWRHIE